MSSAETDRPSSSPESKARHARLGSWFERLCALEGEALQAGLARLDAEEPHLAPQIRGMLDVDGSKARIDDPVTPLESMPASIGPFKILGRLGQGGMGVVWLAEQEHPRREVALKVLRPGSWRPESHAPISRPRTSRRPRRCLK